MSPTRKTRRQNRRGAMLMEVSISALVSGVLLCGALAAVGAVFKTRRVAAEKLHAASLAQQLMGEIMAAPYADPNQSSSGIGVESGESTSTRAAFDDVDDYDGWSSTPPKLKNGSNLADYSGWRRTVSVEFVDPADPSSVIASDSGLKRIIVDVQAPDGEITTRTSLRAAFGAMEYTSGAATTYVTSATVRLQAGSMERPISAGANLVNHAD